MQSCRGAGLKAKFVAIFVMVSLVVSMLPIVPSMTKEAHAASALGGGSSSQVTNSNHNKFDSITFGGKTIYAVYPVGYKNADNDPTYCCAALVKKFYSTIWGVSVSNLIPGRTPKASSGSFTKVSTPKVGDIAGTSSHWGIVKSVSGNKVTIIEQNWSWMKNGALWATKGRTCTLSSGSSTWFWRWSGYYVPKPPHTHSYGTPTYSYYNDVKHTKTAKCSCGAISKTQEACTFAWYGVKSLCRKCRSEVVYHAEGRYVTVKSTPLYKGELRNSGTLINIPAGKVIKVSGVKFNSWGRYIGKVTYGGKTGWIWLIDVEYNGNAGKHTFSGGVCTVCGAGQGGTKPGTYRAKVATTLYKTNVYSATTKTLAKGATVQVTRVQATSYNWYAGFTPDGYIVSMDKLKPTPITSLAASNVTLSYASTAYTGSAKKPSVTVKVNGITQPKDDYVVAYFTAAKLQHITPMSVGTYYVKVTSGSTANTTGSVWKKLVIKPKATTNLKLAKLNNGFKASWTKRTVQCSGYQVAYKRIGTSKWYTKTVAGYKTASKKITGLKDKKTYQVKVRTYKTANGVKYYSAWTGVKKVKTK